MDVVTGRLRRPRGPARAVPVHSSPGQRTDTSAAPAVTGTM